VERATGLVEVRGEVGEASRGNVAGGVAEDSRGTRSRGSERVVKKLKLFLFLVSCGAGLTWVNVYGLSDEFGSPRAIAICLAIGLVWGGFLYKVGR